MKGSLTAIPSQNVLVTGASGALGHVITRELRLVGFCVRGFDRRPPRLPGDHRVGDLLDVEALLNATEGMDAIVHLAGVPDRKSFGRELVPNNIVGTHNLFEAARITRVRRVVLGSSIRVVGRCSWEEGSIGLDTGFAPSDHYGLSKATGELLGQMYADRFGIEVLIARLGWFVRNLEEARQLESLSYGPRIYLSHSDAGDFFTLALQTPFTGGHTVFVTSHNCGDSAFDLLPARRLLGYQPRDSWPEGSRWSDDLRFESPEREGSILPSRPR